MYCMATSRKRVIPRKPAVDDTFVDALVEYLLNRSMRERAEFHEGQFKRHFMDLLEAVGEQVERHKQTITLDTPLPYTRYKGGKPTPVKVVGIERREAVGNVLNEEATLALLARKGLTDECTQTVVVLDEDAILAANYAGKINDTELAMLYEDKSTFSFWLMEDKGE